MPSQPADLTPERAATETSWVVDDPARTTPTDPDHAPGSAGDWGLSSEITSTISATTGWQVIPVEVRPGDTLTLQVVSGLWTDHQGVVSPNRGPGSGIICAKALGPIRCEDPLPDFPRGALIARVGAQVFGVGEGLQVKLEEAGPLALRINEADDQLGDNDGSLTVTIRMDP